MKKKISELVVGDLVDLYADKNKCVEFEFEFQEVEAIEIETSECTAVYFVNGSCIGFPPDHVVVVQS